MGPANREGVDLMRWGDFSLRTKVFAGVVLTSATLIALPVIFSRTSQRQSDAAHWVNHTYEVLQHSESILADIRRLQTLAVGRRVQPDPRIEEAWGRAVESFDRDLADIRTLTADNRGQQERIGEVHAQVHSWLAMLEASLKPNMPPAQPIADLILGTRGVSPNGEAERLLLGFTREERRLLETRRAANESAILWNTTVTRAGALLAVLANLVAAFWLLASLIRPVQMLTDAVRKLHDGDLETRVPDLGKDELGRLGLAFNTMAATLLKNTRDLEKRDVQAGVLKVSEILSSTNDPAHLLDSALERILDVTNCPAGALFLRAGADESLRMMVASGLESTETEVVVRPGEGIIGRAARGSTTLFVRTADEAQANPDESASPTRLAIGQWSGPQRPVEMAYQPLHSGPELVGVLTLAATSPLPDRTRNLLRIIAGQFGPAIQNALSHQTLRRQTVELEARNARLDHQRVEIEDRNRELIVASRLKSEFLANMSHELRTPLTIILGFTNTVLRGTQGELNPEQAASLKRVYDNGRHLLDLINDILDLSKIEAGQMEIDPSAINLRGLAETVVENFHGLARTKGLELRVEVGPSVPVELVTDEARLRQVLVNLIANAIKFTERGEVVLFLRRGLEGQGGCRFEVRDTGQGIATEDIPKIFEQFRQLDGRTTRRAGGTGLGLSIVRRLVSLLGGSLDVQSEVGSGTSFFVNLPDTPANGALKIDFRESPGEATARSGLVLAIDDDREFQALLAAAIKGFPAELRVAGSGKEGLGLAESLRPDAILLDVQMPDMDGWTVLNALKANAATAEIPVIMLTVLQRRGLGLMLGAADYLTKPLDPDRLARALRRVGALGTGGPVLVIDDDPDILTLLGTQLQAGGYAVRLAPSGAEGLRLARLEPPSAVILDLMMPDMDGFEVAAELNRDSDRSRNIPILVLTAKDLTTEDIRRLNGRINEIVQKGSMSLETLVARLTAMLKKMGIVAGGSATPTTNR